jgi:hypothetical protein
MFWLPDCNHAVADRISAHIQYVRLPLPGVDSQGNCAPKVRAEILACIFNYMPRPWLITFAARR